MSRPKEKRDKLLAEWFWTDTWTGSEAFLLPMEARGLYREMLTQAWWRARTDRAPRLPSDPEAIQRATGCTAKEWARAWPKVARFWRVEGDYLVNDVQLEVYAAAVAAYERAQERAAAGGRAKAAQAGAQAGAQAPAQAEIEHPENDVGGLLGGVLKQCPPSPSQNERKAFEPTPSPLLSSSPPPGSGAGGRRRPPANPLVDREKLIREGYRLITLIAKHRDEDPTETVARNSTGDGRFAGSPKAQLETMSDDRLALTVRDLRKEARSIETERRAAGHAGHASAELEGGRRLVEATRRGARPGDAEWARVLAALAAKVNAHSLATWFRPTSAVGVLEDAEGARLVVEVPKPEFRTWLTSNYRDAINEAFAECGLGGWGLAFVTEAEVAAADASGGRGSERPAAVGE